MNIEITEVIDNGDGSVFIGAELDNRAFIAVMSAGINAILRQAVYDCDCETDDEDVDFDEAMLSDWSTEEMSETETKGE